MFHNISTKVSEYIYDFVMMRVSVCFGWEGVCIIIEVFHSMCIVQLSVFILT